MSSHDTALKTPDGLPMHSVGRNQNLFFLGWPLFLLSRCLSLRPIGVGLPWQRWP